MIRTRIGVVGTGVIGRLGSAAEGVPMRVYVVAHAAATGGDGG